MAEITISLKYRSSVDDQVCGVCGATFTTEEDSGSRFLGLKSGKQEFTFLLCGGCHSKWQHGATVTVRSVPA